MTRSLAPIPVDDIRAKFAKTVGLAKSAVEVDVDTGKPFELSLQAVVRQLDVSTLSKLVDLIHDYKLNASTVRHEDRGLVVVLRKRVQICHPEDLCP